ncbi:tripartite tricarboxylate transporter permease [Starkeya sp. ORNL1]|uniref:tripartite tricarboxylate transporter permease n=1 Tax=Starkeya sp. ORNL1 TaxID=2709380 RepID=UPI00146289C1|nr:tripartite tricarboxylate transporter permease [Starkeya sp. ORNL1]QJP14158.1 tripartite tricarboxylate transporter permease [Starkeya sp. ORNL1]
MDILYSLAMGFHVALSPQNLAFCLIGATIGTVVGVLPGIGPVTTIAMLIPLTFQMPAIGSLIMLAGIYYGSHHAGSTTAIMLNMPGEPSAVVVCLDGHPLAKKGKAGSTLAMSAIASFCAGCVGFLIVAALSPELSTLSLMFGPTEYFATIVMALVMASVLTENNLLTTLGMCMFGLLLGAVGMDLTTGDERYAFGIPDLADGVNFVAVAVGLYAFTEIIEYLGSETRTARVHAKIESLIPTRDDLKRSWKPITRGTILGSILGIFPGTGPLISSFAAYAMERRIAKDPSRFGKGAIEGVVAPESAANAAAITHFIPMLTLGIPAGAAMALMLGALQIQGISPGPGVMANHPELFWGLIASMWIGNLMLLVLNLPMIGLWVRLLMMPFQMLYPAIIAFSCIGVYSVQNSWFDLALAAGFGLLGIIFKLLGCNPAPLILAMVLEPMLEENFRRSMIIGGGNAMVFLKNPISLGILLLTLVLTIYLRARKHTVMDEFDPTAGEQAVETK